jgi:hypothetical protein
VVLWAIIAVFEYDNVLYQSDFLYIFVIIFVWVYIRVLNIHHEFINLHIKGFCNFLSQKSNGLEIANMYLSSLRIVSVQNSNIKWLQVSEMGLLKFWLQSLFTFIPIQEFTNKLNSVGNQMIIVRIKVSHALFYKAAPYFSLFLH